MEITSAQYARIEPVLPRQRGNVRFDNFTLIVEALRSLKRALAAYFQSTQTGLAQP